LTMGILTLELGRVKSAVISHFALDLHCKNTHFMRTPKLSTCIKIHVPPLVTCLSALQTNIAAKKVSSFFPLPNQLQEVLQ